jgi:hypothetical protein
MAVDPYSPCPCGSGKKFKWCCHKVEAHAERSEKLYENGQTAQALAVLEEGLRKDPGNAWLLTRKALILSEENRPAEAKAALGQVVARQPRNLGAVALMTQIELETEGVAAGTARLQQALTAFPGPERKPLFIVVRMVGAVLAESGHVPAAVRHLELARSLLDGEPDPAVESTLRMIRRNASTPLWLRDEYRLSPVPEGLSGEAVDRFRDALGWADEGLWSSAAAAFETLSADPAAERNLGFCRLWLADDEAAAAALRRYTARVPVSPETVDLEVLCQLIAGDDDGETVEHVQLIWPLRDRAGLLTALEADPAAAHDGTGPMDPDDPNAPEAEEFLLLDRANRFRGDQATVPDGGAGLTLDDIPRILGRVYVGQEIAALEAPDDGRLDRLSDRLTGLAGPALAPAHPRTKVIGKVSRVQVALTWEWQIPEGTSQEHARRLNREQGAKLISEVWPTLPRGFLKGRTPLQAAGSPDAELALRAAVLLLEGSHEPWHDGFDFAALRDRLKLRPEPEPDPETVDVASLSLARLAYVPAERLSDEKLAALYRRARGALVPDAIERSARALVQRPGAMEAQGVEPLALYGDLAMSAAAHKRHAEAADWLRRGRQAEPAATRARSAPHWDMLELQFSTQTRDPEDWVPELAVILDRYRENTEANQVVMLGLVELGLLRMTSAPDDPGKILLDPRPLQLVLERYGPRVTTSSGRLGVSAAKPEIWTPGGESGSSGGIWTPGSTPPSGGGGEKKIIITGP